MANKNIRLRKKNGSAWDVLYPESLAKLIKVESGENVQTFIDTVYDKIATPTENGAMSKEDKAKLNNIEAGANKYIHPDNESTRHVTDTQIKSWNDKYTKLEIDNKFNELNIGLDWKESVDSFSDLATAYPNPKDGWTVNVKDVDITYRYTGTTWIAISANSIPLATQLVDGKMSKTDKKILDNLKPRVDSIAADLDAINQEVEGSFLDVTEKFSKIEKTINGHTTSITNLNSNKADKNHSHDSSYAAIDHDHGNYSDSKHNHDSKYLSLNGGTINGALNIKTDQANIQFQNAAGEFVGKIRGNDEGAVIVSAGNGKAKTIYLRPSGDTSTDNELIVGENKLRYNGKAISLDGHGNHVPQTQAANDTIYLRNDNTWQVITPEKIGAASSTHTHDYIPSTGGNITGNLKFTQDNVLMWYKNTDYAKIGFKNDGDNDTDSYMCFETGDNSNEYFAFKSGKSPNSSEYEDSVEWMTIKGDGVRVKGKLVYHEGNKPKGSDIIQSSSHRLVTDAEKSAWNAKASTAIATTSSNGLMTAEMVTKLNNTASTNHGRHVPDACDTITDWNNATKTGWYMANNAANAPGSGWYFGEVIAHNSNYFLQTVYAFTASSDAKSIPKYIRAKMNGVWGAWTNVTVQKAVPSNAVFTDTNTWRGIQNNLTSDSTTDSLSAAQGKVLKGLIDEIASNSNSSISGNAATATKLQTPRTITIGSAGKTFDGSGNVSWSLSEIGAAAASHTHSYLPLSGGTLTGKVTFSNNGFTIGNSTLSYNSNSQSILWNANDGNRLFGISKNGLVECNDLMINNNIEAFGNIISKEHYIDPIEAYAGETGVNPRTSARLVASVDDKVGSLKVQLGGTDSRCGFEVIDKNWKKALFSVTNGGEVTFASREPKTGELVSLKLLGTAGNYKYFIPAVAGDGVMEVGKYIDFHDPTSTSDYEVRLTSGSGNLNCSGTFSQGSDRALKENIHYIDDEYAISTCSTRDIKLNRFKDFIKNDLKVATYNYKNVDDTVIGFIAQDVYDNDIAKYFVKEVTNDEKTGAVLNFDLSGYTTIVAKALQEEIIEKDKKIEELENRLAKIEALLSI